MLFIYDLHDSLALADTGVLVLGIVALAWTIDCFVGAHLTSQGPPQARCGWRAGASRGRSGASPQRSA